VGVIGLGHVGRATAAMLSSYYEITAYDAANDLHYPYGELKKCGFAVVYVDTPFDPDGACDTSNVADAIAALPCDRVLLKSTVAPGTTERLAAHTGR
jgi:UDPglucose 6-dehydrogenase